MQAKSAGVGLPNRGAVKESWCGKEVVLFPLLRSTEKAARITLHIKDLSFEMIGEKTSLSPIVPTRRRRQLTLSANLPLTLLSKIYTRPPTICHAIEVARHFQRRLPTHHLQRGCAAHLKWPRPTAPMCMDLHEAIVVDEHAVFEVLQPDREVDTYS